jgi:hypothetical protein
MHYIFIHLLIYLSIVFFSNQAQDDRLHKLQGCVEGLVSNRFVQFFTQ